MLIECGVSVYGAISAHSPALLAFGADSFEKADAVMEHGRQSLVEVLAAVRYLMKQFKPARLKETVLLNTHELQGKRQRRR
jgi:hypothetical protein